MEQRTDEHLNYMTKDEANLYFAEPVPWSITFNNENGKQVGKLFFNDDGRMDFEGDPTKSAEVFFTAFIGMINEEWEKRYAKE